MEGEEAFYEIWTIREFGNSFVVAAVVEKGGDECDWELSVLALPPWY